jgi:hypothetical protein
VARVTAAKIAVLPPPVQRCLRHAGAVGTRIPKRVTVRQKGKLRIGTGGVWLPFTAEQKYRVNRVEFLWKATLRAGGIPIGVAADWLRHGHGHMHVQVAKWFTAVDATGPEMDQGALMRWLNETMWFPGVWVTDVVSWEPIDATSAVASVTAGGLTAKGEFRFARDGCVVDFVGDRYRTVKDGYELRRWSTPITGRARFENIEVPSAGTGVWMLEDGDFEYIRLKVTDIRHEA